MAESVPNLEDAILRDQLALDRTRLANERTLLAYLRTALMLLVSGATAVTVVDEDISNFIFVAGWVFIVFSALVAMVGVWRFLAMRRSISQRRHK